MVESKYLMGWEASNEVVPFEVLINLTFKNSPNFKLLQSNLYEMSKKYEDTLC